MKTLPSLILARIRPAAAIAALALLPAFTATAATINASVFSASGDAEYAPPGSTNYQPLHKGLHLGVGSTIRTGDNGVAVIVTTPGSAIQIGNDSVVKINELAFQRSNGSISQREAHLQLTSGVVSALIDPSTPKVTDFQVATPEGAAAARGTFFAVLVYHGKTYVGVKEGKVGAVATEQ
jgi:hypothetical protein